MNLLDFMNDSPKKDYRICCSCGWKGDVNELHYHCPPWEECIGVCPVCKGEVKRDYNSNQTHK